MTAAIVGIGRTPFTSGADVSAPALAAEAIAAALRDAGRTLDEVDGVVRFDRQPLWEYDLPGVMRLHGLHVYAAVPDAPGSAPALIRLATTAVRQGLGRVIVAYHARADARPALAAEVQAALGGGDEPGCLVQGGCALVLEAWDAASAGAVRVLGSMQAAIPSAARHLDAWRSSRDAGVVSDAARRMYAAAGITPIDVDVACLYTHPGILVRLARDDFSLAERTRVNPHAGGPDAAALDGMDDLLEAVRQVRGGARVALVAGSPLEPTSAVLLGAPA
jgi:hypothetical protein